MMFILKTIAFPQSHSCSAPKKRKNRWKAPATMWFLLRILWISDSVEWKEKSDTTTVVTGFEKAFQRPLCLLLFSSTAGWLLSLRT